MPMIKSQQQKVCFQDKCVFHSYQVGVAYIWKNFS